jgi:hypothetical protein
MPKYYLSGCFKTTNRKYMSKKTGHVLKPFLAIFSPKMVILLVAL